jgi:Dolichyl-phosphate-mannose-protein mannosyltransferase
VRSAGARNRVIAPDLIRISGAALALGVGLIALTVQGNQPSQVLGGLPLSSAGMLAAAGLLYVGIALPRPGRRASLCLALGFSVVLGLRLVAASTAPPLGLRATYWARATSEGPAERSTDYPWLVDATRIDTTLDLRGESFPVHFFNDAARFNFGLDVQPSRDQLPFKARWEGWLLAPSDGPRRFLVESTGPAQVTLDEASLPAPETPATLASGLHALRVEYTRPEARVPWLRVSWERTPGGPLEPMAGQDLRWQPSAAAAGLSSVLRLVADWAMLALILAWAGTGLLRAQRTGRLARAAMGALPLLFLVHGMLLLAPQAGRATILSGLDDWLIYESSARDILLNGPLMDAGQGHAAPFYGQPLYPYVLALAHRLTGEGLFGPLALQFAALGLVVVGTALLAGRAFGSRLDGLVALACFLVLLNVEAEHFKVARQLFNENLYMPLVMASLTVMVGLASAKRPPTWWRATLVGVLLGLTAISRSQFLLFIPFGLLTLFLAWRTNARPALVALAALVVGLLLAIAPVTARNWLVSGQVVPISSSGGASLLEFHRPPSGLVDPAGLTKDPLYEALHLDTQTRTVVAFVRADPGGYLATLLPLGAHSVGLQGRNDPGIYWPLFLTTLLYVASFAFHRTRQVQVWPIHAFVATHLLVLMLFEADTYGYRLVMPMYAPMVAVASQVPLALIRWLLGARRSVPAFRLPNADRAGRYAIAGWGVIAVLALLAQAKTLVDIWPERDLALHGLGGPAARAAATADGVGAEAIYVASIDGTPRRFGAGALPGLRYPWFKWFDPSRSVPLPSASSTAVYMLSELSGQTAPGELVACLGAPDPSSELVISGAQARQQCVGDWPPSTSLGAVFEGVARIDAVHAPEAVEAGDALETRLLWQPLTAHPEPQQVSLQLDDPASADATLWGNGTLELYPARQWDPSEAVLSRVPVATEPTAIPQPYRLTLGIGPTRQQASPAAAVWRGARTERVPVAMVSLSLGSSRIGQALPADMRALEGPPLIGGGLELSAARPLAAQAAIGGPLRIGLLWQAMQDAPDAAQLRVRLVRASSEVVQESTLPLLGGRLIPSALRAGNVVRDEQTLLIGASVPAEQLSITVDVLDAHGAQLSHPSARLGSVEMTGRAHDFDSVASGAAPEAVFGAAMQLVGDGVEPARARANEKVTVHLRWRSAVEMQQAYKVFVHVLDPAGQHVVAQRDAEPQDGHAPTTGWVVGEIIQDDYVITLPANLAAGDYPVEIGVYDARSGDRLPLPNGDTRVILSTRLHATP